MEPTSVHAYGEHPDQQVSIYRTRALYGAEPVIVVVHGGYWRQRVAAEAVIGVVTHLLKAGYDVANVEYRRGPVDGAWPIVRDDVRAAIATVREVFGDRTLIGLGHSVGGELVLLAANQLDAIIALAPATDAARVHTEQLGEGAAQEYFGASPDEAAERYREASPIHQPAPTCQTLIVHGRDDDRVPLAHTLDYLRAHRSAPIDLLVDHQADHLDVADPTHQVWRQVEAWLTRFDRAK